MSLDFKKFRLTLFSILFFVIAYSQEYQTKIYRVEDGLPGDVIKAVAQDSLGFLWIATDDGLVQFDGLRFSPFKNALHSQYAKGFLETSDGRLLLYGDLDLVEIQNKIDTVIFKTVKAGGRNPTDSVLWYPKSVYEDSKRRLWVGEPQSVVLLEGDKLTRFSFELSDRSPQFLRSFSFFENQKGEVFICSYFGRVYKYAGSKLEKQEMKFPLNVNLITRRNGVLWIAAADGVYTFNPEGNERSATMFLPLRDPETIYFLDANTMLVGGGYKNHVMVNIQTRAVRPIAQQVNNINSFFLSKEQDIWIACSEGLVLLQKNVFETVDGPFGFVESIAEDTKTKTIYYCNMTDLFKVHLINGRLVSESIMSIPNGYFLSLCSNEQGLWVANAFSVYLLKNERIVKKWDFESEGRFVHDLFLDQDQNLWLTQSGNTFISCITRDLKVRHYKIPLLQTSIVNAVRVNEQGVYVAANGKGSYLFFKPKSDSVFKSVGLPVDFQIHGDFNINDIAFSKGSVWLASSEGLLKYDGKKVERVDLGEKYSTVSVKTVEQLNENQVLFANSFGLFRYNINDKTYWLFDEGNGMASNTITSRGIFIDSQKRVWVGTSRGLSYAGDGINKQEKSVAPYFVEARVNAERQRFRDGLQLNYGSFLNLTVSAITFPESKVDIQYRISRIENRWHSVEKNLISLSELAAGNYTIEIRARKVGGYQWSDVRTMLVTIKKPFWQQAWFLIVILALVAIISWVSFSIAVRINRNRRNYLEHLIEERTAELMKTNQELTTRNSELDRFVYSASHDLSAPLKSLLGLINISRMEIPSPVLLGYLGMME
jgi:ligand-binding sensor domain-containing protein